MSDCERPEIPIKPRRTRDTHPPPSHFTSKDSSNRQFSSDTVSDALSDHDLHGIIPRLLRNIVVASFILLIPAFVFYGLGGVVGFAFGAAISYINFRALKRAVERLGDRIVNHNSHEKGGWIVVQFMGRYGLVAAAAYAIFVSSVPAFRGFLWGLCVPVAALMGEGVWAGYCALRRV